MAAEILVTQINELPPDERPGFSQQIAHVSADLRKVMDRRAQGLDEDWSEDALPADEEVEEVRRCELAPASPRCAPVAMLDVPAARCRYPHRALPLNPLPSPAASSAGG